MMILLRLYHDAFGLGLFSPTRSVVTNNKRRVASRCIALLACFTVAPRRTARGTAIMDFSTLLKGATDTLANLDTNDPSTSAANASTSANANTGNSWQQWDTGEDDTWEDVTDIVPSASSAVPAHRPPLAPVGVMSPPGKSLSSAHPRLLTPDVNGTTTASASMSPTNIGKPDAPTQSTSLPTPVHLTSAATTPTKITDKQQTEQQNEQIQQQLATLSAQLRTALERASAAERKVIVLSRTRDKATAASAAASGDLEARLAAMREEGDKLSVKIAEKEQSVRTLRATLRDRDNMVEELQATSSAIGAKLEASAARIRQLETAERAANDAREAAERRAREVEVEARGKSTSSAALEAARSQLEALRKSQTTALQTQAMRLTADKDQAVQDLETRHAAREEEISKTVEELRAHLAQVVDHASWREDQLRRETDELRMRAQTFEARNEELAAALPNATRPLIRQVEALQAAADERDRAKTVVDRSHVERLRVAESAAAAAAQREAAAEEQVSKALAKIAGLEERVRIAQSEVRRSVGQIADVRAECAQREEQAERDTREAVARAEKAERERDRNAAEVRSARAAHMDAIEAAEERERELRKQLGAAESQVAVLGEREREYEARERKRQHQHSSASSSSAGLMANGRYDGSMGLGSPNGARNGTDVSSVGESVVSGMDDGADELGVYATERLSTSLRLRSGEVDKLQAQLDAKDKATRALAEEVVSLTARLEQASGGEHGADAMQAKLDELAKRHETLLELLGEREERIGELDADLADMKAMYKEQVTELLLRIERLSA